MAVFTVDPAAVGHHDEWANTGGSDKVDSVDDGATPDDDTTYISTGVTARQQSFYVPNISTADIPSGSTINSVTLAVRARCTNPSGFNSIDHGIYDGSSDYEVQAAGDLPDGAGNYGDFSYEWTTDPSTASAWAEATIRDWASGGATPRSFGVVSDLNAGNIRVTRIRVTIDYTESGGTPQTGTGVGWGVTV